MKYLSILLIAVTFSAHAANRQEPVYAYSPEYTQTKKAENLTFRFVAEKAVENNTELNKLKQERDTEAKRIDKAISSLFPEIRASAAMNTLDKTRIDYREKAVQDNVNAKIKMKQILFSDSVIANKNTAEYKASVHKLAAESVRLDIIRDAADSYYSLLRLTDLSTAEKNHLGYLNSIRQGLKARKARKSDYARIDKLIKASKSRITQLEQDRLNEISILETMIGQKIAADCSFESYEKMLDANGIKDLSDIFTSLTTEEKIAKVKQFFTEKALDDSPELMAIDELLKLNKRDIKTEKRKFVLPDVSINGEYTQYLDKKEDSDEYTADFSKNDWSLNLRLSMPIFDGKRSSPDLYAKNTERIQYLNKRAELRDTIKIRMENTVDWAVDAESNRSMTADIKNEADKNLKKQRTLYDAKKLKLSAQLTACEDYYADQKDGINAGYSLVYALNDLQRAYGKFFFMSQDYEDNRFIYDLRAAAEGR